MDFQFRRDHSAAVRGGDSVTPAEGPGLQTGHATPQYTLGETPPEPAAGQAPSSSAGGPPNHTLPKRADLLLQRTRLEQLPEFPSRARETGWLLRSLDG